MRSLVVTAVVLLLPTVGRAETRIESAERRIESAETPAMSVSCGWANRGALAGALALAPRGFGWQIPDPWRERSRNWGTQELLQLITRVAAEVATDHPGAILGVADLSGAGGGAIAGHRSHQSGRDVDLIYYSSQKDGTPRAPDSFMAYYTATGQATYARAPVFEKDIGTRYFDVARNWSLVKALLTDGTVEVEQMFVSHRIKRWLLAHAESIGESPELLALAQRTLRRPKDGESHNDHMHLRIACSDSDVAEGRCRNGAFRRARGSRWHARMACPAAEIARAQ